MIVPIEKPGTPKELVQNFYVHKVNIGQKFVSEFLSHHGVKGMKWGVRKEDQILNSSKTSVKGGYATAITPYAIILASYATFHLIDSGKVHQFRSKNTTIKVNKNLARKNLSVDQLHKTVVKPINPDFGKMGTKQNCRRCTFSYELRRRGLDVNATKTIGATGQTWGNVVKASHTKESFISPDIKSLASKSIWGENQIGDKKFYNLSAKKKSDAIFSELDKLPNRSRGELAFGWHFGGGHSVAWENINGKAVVFDTQSGKKYDSSAFSREFGVSIHEAAYTRLDNKDLNMDFLGRWTQNVN